MFVLLIIFGSLIALLSRINFRKLYLAFKIPGPFPLPIVGNGLKFINKSSAEHLRIAHEVLATYGNIFGVWMKSDFHVFVTDPNAIEELLSSKSYIEKAILYRFIKPWLNEGLLLSTDTKWFQRRKLLTPAFHFKILEQFVDIFDRQSCFLIDNLKRYGQADRVEMFPLITNYALDVICQSAMGTELNAQQSLNREYVEAVKKMSHVIHFRMVKYYYREDWIFRFTSLYKDQQNALKLLHGFTDNVIHERRKVANTKGYGGSVKNDFDESLGEKRKMNLLDILLQSTVNGEPLSNLEIREEVDTFMFEGHDTTSSAILFSLYNIAKYPDVQQKCFQEIRDVLSDDPQKSVSLTVLNNLNYLDLVIKETLRIYPSVPFIGRKLREEYQLGKYIIPKDTDVVVPIIFYGRDATLFPDPERFWPERFLAENGISDTNHFTYIPFSAGPRNCIGQRFAVLELKSVLSKVLRFFEIALADDSLQNPVLTAELILVSDSKINFHIKPRLYE